MKQFNVTYPSGLTDEEVVSDCATIEEYCNRKFGSADYEANGVKVEMVDLGGDEEKAEDEPKGTGETITTKISGVEGTATEEVGKNLVLDVDSLKVGSTL